MDEKEIQVMQHVKTGVKNVEVRFEWALDRQIIESVQDEPIRSPKYDVQLDKESTSWCLEMGSVKKEESEDFTHMSLFLYGLSGVFSERGKLRCKVSTKNDEGKLTQTKTFTERKMVKGNGWGWNQFLDIDDLPDLYVNDKITIVCDLVFVIEKNGRIHNDTDDWANLKRKYDSVESETGFMKQMKSLYGFDSLSDLVIFCGDQKYLCHKLVLASRSDVFQDMFENENEKEKIKGEFEITDETSPDVFKLLIDNIYTGMIPSNIDKVAKELYRLAIKYNLRILAKACEISLLGQITDANALDTLATMDKHKFATSAKEDVIKYITINAKEIIDTDEFKTFSKEQPELMIEIVRCFSENQNKEVLSTLKTEGTA